MEKITVNFDSAKSIGIDILTSEACNIGMRMLCELSKACMETYLEWTGISIGVDDISCSYWNNSSKYSVFLTWETIEDLVIMRLLDTNEVVAEVIPNPGRYGFNHLIVGTADEIFRETHSNGALYDKYVVDENDQCVFVKGIYKVGRTYRKSTNTHVGFSNSNVHAFSGMHQ